MIALLLAAVVATSTPQCAATGSNEKLVQQMDLASYGRTLVASTYEVPGDGVGGIAATRLLIHSPACEPLFAEEFEGTTEIKLTLVRLAKTPFLVASVLSPGGSGCGLNHVLISYDGEPRAFAPAALGHDNMGGLYVGDLGHGRGPGLVLLEALWDGGSHYDPHPYRAWVYRWTDQRFIGPQVTKTKPMRPDPARVARSLGLPFSAAMSFDC